jgi:PKD repeat protein
MKKLVTCTLAVACLACWASSAIAETAGGGQLITRRCPDDAPPSGPSARDPDRIVAPENQAPAVAINGPSSGAVFPVNTPVSFVGTFNDEPGNTHSALWRFGAVSVPGSVTEAGGSASLSHTFDTPGVYSVSLTVTDQGGLSGTATTVNGPDARIVVYQARAESVTAHGRIDSPAGSFPADPQASGRADLWISCSYAAGASAPGGSARFKFRGGDFDFRSTTLDWLVIQDGHIQLAGSGTMGGAASFGFMLWAVDGQVSGGADLFRIRITSATGAVVYDSQMGAADTADPAAALTFGWIEIIAPAASQSPQAARATPAGAGLVMNGAPLVFDLAQNSPNPFVASTEVVFSLPERSHLKLAVFDVAGREIATLARGAWDAGSHSVRWSGRTDSGETARRGVYFVRMACGLASGEQRFVSVRKMIVLD